jgi:hypothetical protein
MTVDTARERTRLAWRRTVLASTVVALLFIRLAGPFAALAVPPWLVVLAVAQRRISAVAQRRISAVAPAGRILPVRELALVALMIATLAVSGAALAVLP